VFTALVNEGGAFPLGHLSSSLSFGAVCIVVLCEAQQKSLYQQDENVQQSWYTTTTSSSRDARLSQHPFGWLIQQLLR
jgi:hypothetical protein